METFSALLAICAGDLPVTGEFPSQRSIVFFDLRLNRGVKLASHNESLLMSYIPGTKQCCTRPYPGPALQGMNELSTQRVIK